MFSVLLRHTLAKCPSLWQLLHSAVFAGHLCDDVQFCYLQNPQSFFFVLASLCMWVFLLVFFVYFLYRFLFYFFLFCECCGYRGLFISLLIVVLGYQIHCCFEIQCFSRMSFSRSFLSVMLVINLEICRSSCLMSLNSQFFSRETNFLRCSSGVSFSGVLVVFEYL